MESLYASMYVKISHCKKLEIARAPEDFLPNKLYDEFLLN